MRYFASLACASLVSLCLFSADHYMIGHSLVNHQMPRALQQLADDAGLNHSYRAAIIGGASLKWHWENPHLGEGGAHSYNDLASGQYNALLLTDQVPVKPSFQWNKTADYANNYVAHTLNATSDLSVYLYQTWPHLDPTKWIEDDWDTEIATDILLWESLADQLDTDYALSNTVKIVPGAYGLQALRAAIESGSVPGLNALTDIFRDQIHMNNTGDYFIACIFFATYFGQSPEGLTATIYNEYGNIAYSLDSSLAIRLQQVAWDVVHNYSRSAPSNSGGGNTATATALDDSYDMTSTNSKSGLVGYWPFEDSGTLVADDATGLSGYGTAMNMTPDQLGVPGKFGNAVSFDGLDDYMDLSGAESLMPIGSFTVGMWYKGEATSRAPLLASGFDYGQRYGFRLEGFERSTRPRPRWRVGNERRGWTLYGQEIAEQEWHHIAVCFDGQQARLFIDGAFIANRHISGITYNADYGICLGADLRGGYYYKGLIDELQVYNRVLSDAEISSWANATPQFQAPAPGVLYNDEHSEENPVAVLVEGPSNGTLDLNQDGSFTYRPDFGFNGQDQFTYRVETANVSSEPATVRIQVQ